MTDATGPGAGQSLGIGSIVSESFSLSFANFFKLLAIIIVPIILMGVVAYLLLGSMIDPAMAQPPIDSSRKITPSAAAITGIR